MRRRISCLAFILIGGLTGAPTAQEVQPHRALYEIALDGPSDLFASARGLAATEMRLTCNAWRFSQRFELETVPVSGEPSRAVLLLDATEGLDGESYAFRSSNDYGDGDPLELIGRAEMSDVGGLVAYTEPARVEGALPADTGFAVSAVRDALKAAMAGARQHRSHWFVGSTPDEPMLVNSIVVPTPPVPDAQPLLAGKRWRFLSAFFSRSDEATPLYEGEETMVSTGVLASATYRYEGYALRLTLQRLEALPAPAC